MLPEIFASWAVSGGGTMIGREYLRVGVADPQVFSDLERPPFARWNMPLDHMWPCRPGAMEGFVEKAAGTIHRKFEKSGIRSIRMGAVDPAAEGGYYRRMASNLRGRTLQLFPPFEAGRDHENQPSGEKVLFCLVGKEGLFCGVATSKDCQGFHPGGTRYTSQNLPGTISRAGAKLVEALHHLRLFRPAPVEGGHWLELGASPGGMTSELLRRGLRVTAVDRAPLDDRLRMREGLVSHQMDAAHFVPPPAARFDGLLCDMNGNARDSLDQVIRLSQFLADGAPVIFTLKAGDASGFAALVGLYLDVCGTASKAGLPLISRAHLTYNRFEFTLFFEKSRMPT